MNGIDRVVITGGGGMLAHALNKSLAARGVATTALPRTECDLTKPDDIRRLFDELRPAVIFNCAAHTKVDLCEEQEESANAINGRAVGDLAAAAKEHDAALVHFSTDFVFDGSAKRPYRAEEPTGPLSAYGRSKLLGEQELQRHAPTRWLILRTAWLYGPHGPCFPQTILKAARAGKPLSVVSDQIGSPTFTYDLAEAAIDLLDRGATGLWHVTNAGSTSWHGFTAAILEEFGLTAPLTAITSADWKKQRPASATRPAYSVLNLAPLENAIGRPMPDWRDALARYRDALEGEPAV